MSTEFEIPVVGNHFRDPQEKEAMLGLAAGDALVLEREPDNQYDANAIKVMLEHFHLGYVGKEFAVDMAPLLDTEDEYTCEVNYFLAPNRPVLTITVG